MVILKAFLDLVLFVRKLLMTGGLQHCYRSTHMPHHSPHFQPSELPAAAWTNTGCFKLHGFELALFVSWIEVSIG